MSTPGRFCASGLEFPNGPTGSSTDEWPASGGGNRLTWDSSIDCQTTTLGMDGVHAVAGSFYVYAYSDDLFQVTPNNNLSTAPELQVGDCSEAVFDLQLSPGGGGLRVRVDLGVQPLLRGRPRPPALLHRRAGGRRR